MLKLNSKGGLTYNNIHGFIIHLNYYREKKEYIENMTLCGNCNSSNLLLY